MRNRLSSLVCLCLLLSACGAPAQNRQVLAKICAHPISQGKGTITVWHGTGPDLLELKTTDSQAPYIFFDAAGNSVFSLQNGMINEKYSLMQLQSFQKIRGDRKEGETIKCSELS